MTDYEAVHFMNAQHVHGAAEKKLHSHTHSYTGHAASVGFTVSEDNKLSTYVRNVHTRKTKSNQNTDILKKLINEKHLELKQSKAQRQPPVSSLSMCKGSKQLRGKLWQ